MRDGELARQLLRLALENGEAAGLRSRLVGRRITASDAALPDLDALPAKIPEREQSNSNVLFDEKLILKLYRRLDEGVNPELEIGEHLTKVGFTNTAPVPGSMEILSNGSRRTLGGGAEVRPSSDRRVGHVSGPRSAIFRSGRCTQPGAGGERAVRAG